MTATKRSVSESDDPDDEVAQWQRLYEHPALVAGAMQSHEDELALQTRLRHEFPPELVRIALQLVAARRKAVGKFSLADEMWFDRQAVEQATTEPVARYKATRFAGQECWDLCSGAGMDAIALASAGSVHAVDRRPLVGRWLEWNAERYGVRPNVDFTAAGAQELDWTGRLVHIDPDRRAAPGSRSLRLEDYEPALEWLQSLTTQARGGAIKLGPASNFGGKFDGAEIELISLRGECKEATVWFGELAGTALFRATVLPSGASISGHPLEARADVSPLRRYLYDPDPAVVRAGLVELFCAQQGLERLDSAEEYLTSDTLIETPLATAFEVLAELPNNEQQLRKALREGGFGAVEVKCRHLKIAVDALTRRLPRTGTRPGVIFFARLTGRSRIVLARRVPTGAV